MASPTQTPETSLDLAVLVAAAPLLEGAHVLYVGRRDEAVLDALADHADGATYCRLGGGGRLPDRDRVRVQTHLKGLHKRAPFDAVVVPDVSLLGEDLEDALAELGRHGDGGVFVLGAPAGSDDDYDDFVDAVESQVGSAQTFGVAAFAGQRVAPFAGSKGLLVDDRYAPEGPLARYAAVVGDELDEATVVATALDAAAAEPGEDVDSLHRHAEELEAALGERDAEIADLRAALEDAEVGRAAAEKAAADAEGRGADRRDLERAERRAEDAEADADEARADAKAAKAEAKKLRNALDKARSAAERANADADEAKAAARRAGEAADAARADAESAKAAAKPKKSDKPKGKDPRDAEIDALEARLRERASAVRELEREAERLKLVARDLIEAAQAGPGGGVPAEALVAAEADAVEARFERDRLRAELAQKNSDGAAEAAEALETKIAELEGAKRGLRARAAELQERLELAEGQLAVAGLDIEAAQEKGRADLAAAEERAEGLELELVRLRSRPASPGERRVAELEESEARLSRRVGELSGQLQAAKALADSTPPDTLADEGDAAAAHRLEGEIIGLRMRLSAMVAGATARYAAAAAAPVVEPEPVAGAGDTMRVAELEETLAARDALVARLQRDLGEAERAEAEASRQAKDASSEKERLREAVVVASEDADEARSVAADLQRELDDAKSLLVETREALASVQDAGGDDGEGDASAPRVSSRDKAELEAQQTLLRSLTAQVEERNDRIRALEGELARTGGTQEVAEAAELRERVARLRDDLEVERNARATAEARAAEIAQGTVVSEGSEELADLERSLKEAELSVDAAKDDVRALSSVVGRARRDLEGILGAVAGGDPMAADRIGDLLTYLGRY